MQISDLVYIDLTGYHYADFPTFLSYIQNLFRSIYGEDVYLEPDSQDGQWTTALAQALFDSASVGSSTYLSFMPTQAQGTGLSRVVKINGLSRRAPTYSTVDVLISGAIGAVITDGVAIDTLNQKWDIPETVIPGAGFVTVTATAQKIGAIRAEASTVNRIFTPMRGWVSVNNVAAATPGVPVEIDAELRERQAISTANPSLTVMEGTVGAVANVDGVTAVRGYENDTGSTDSNTIPAHSISLIVAGGTTLDVAQTIADHKTPGTGTYGSTSQMVYDSHGMPLNIHFYRPTTKAVKAQVTIAALTGWTSDYEDLIKQAVADFINGIGIGNNVLISRLYVPANLSGDPISSTYDVSLIEIAFVPDSFGTSNLSIAFNQQPTCDVDDVAIIVT